MPHLLCRTQVQSCLNLQLQVCPLNAYVRDPVAITSPQPDPFFIPIFSMASSWSLACSNCSATRTAAGLPTVCPECHHPWLVRYETLPALTVREIMSSRPWDMWRYQPWLPLMPTEKPVTLGEGCTPLLPLPGIQAEFGLAHVWMKDEGQNPCGSFKSRGLSAAVTRAVLDGATRFVLPTAGNAGVAAAAYGTRGGLPVRVYAPRGTPPTLLAQVRHFGADLHLIDGHIGDCGKEAHAYAAETGATNLSTLKEPYRIEGKKTLGLELAEQLGWTLPDCIIYPTGGGTGLIGMWKAFQELQAAGWISVEKMPRLISVQAEGCAPVVHAFETGATSTAAWPNPVTSASGLRVPDPLGGKLMLSALRQSGGGAIAISEEAFQEDTVYLMQQEGIDAAPEGGATLAALRRLVADGVIQPEESVVLFNTGAGWLYR